MPLPLIDPLISWLARFGLALLFASAAAHKLRAPSGFTATLRAYRVMPDALAPHAAAAAIGIELALAACLLLPLTAPFGAQAAAALLGVYSGAIALNLRRGRRDIDCGCLGSAGRQPLSEWLLARNACLLAVAGLAALPCSLRTLVWMDAVSLLAGLLVASLLFVSLSGLGAVTQARSVEESP